MTQPIDRAATIEDVARTAGVSRAAVSKVLRNAYGVSPAMRKRVGEAIEELQYRPRVAARAMRGSSYTLGIEIPDFGNPFFARVLEGASRALGGTNYQLIIAPAEAGKRMGYRAIEALVDQQVDGVVGVAPLITREWLERIARRTPVVMFGRHDLSDAYDSVAGNDAGGTLVVMDHLFDLGHDRVLHFTIAVVESDEQRHTPHSIRYHSYLSAMEQSGRKELIRVARVDDSEDFGEFARDYLRQAVAAGDVPTAIFAAHDELGLAALGAVSDLGLDIAVVGYDDVPMSQHPMVSMSSVDQQGEAMGARAVEMLLSRLQGRDEALHETYEPVLKVRNSSRRGPRG